jgi:uncharacterized protein (DUF488 family)
MWTVGHSTRSLAELVALLRAHGVERVVDVRKMPRSRRHPHFNVDTLGSDLRAAGIGYAHMPGLGGLRRGRPDSVNTAWRNPSFRAYADYMATDEFAANLDALIAQGRAARVTIMCAEALWWRCHRSLIADALVAHGVPVLHIVDATRAEPHVLRAWAHVEGGRITYPGPPELFDSPPGEVSPAPRR